MKNKVLYFVSVIAIIGLMTYGLTAMAETQRLGMGQPPTSFSFNGPHTVAKTAAYTATASDDIINVATSSATITITLPTVTSMRPGSKTFKIVKTDANAYDVIVAAATGDTIGGEAQRHIVAQNGYMVISTGTGKNWTVDYESPYLLEDHSAGSYTNPVVSATNNLTVTGNATVSNNVKGREGTFTNVSTTAIWVGGHPFTLVSTAGSGSYLKYVH